MGLASNDVRTEVNGGGRVNGGDGWFRMLVVISIGSSGHHIRRCGGSNGGMAGRLSAIFWCEVWLLLGRAAANGHDHY